MQAAMTMHGFGIYVGSVCRSECRAAPAFGFAHLIDCIRPLLSNNDLSCKSFVFERLFT